MSEENKEFQIPEVDTTSQLTDENVEDILKVMQENVDSNPDLDMIANLPSNSDVEYHEPEEGEAKVANVTIDLETGEKRIESLVNDDEVDDRSIDDIFEDLGDAANDIDFDNFDIGKDDIKSAIEQSQVIEGEFPISDQAVIALIDAVNKYRNKGKVTYSDMPSEIKKYIDDYCSKMGIDPMNRSKDANTMRNTVTDLLVSEFESNISMDKYINKFNEEVESAFTGMNREISTYVKEYDADKKAYLEKACANITDPEKKAKMEQIMEAIYDSYKLNRMRDYKIRIKKIELEKPTRIFDPFHLKYTNTSYSMYDLVTVTGILDKHLEKAGYEKRGLEFLIKFCKFTTNYKPENPEEHAFMYYTVYNIILLDIYQGEQYDEYAPEFLKNINDVITCGDEN